VRHSSVYLAIFFSIVCMSTASIMIKLCSAPAMIIAMYRVMFTAVLAVPFGGRNYIPGLQATPRKDFLYIIGAGFFLALHFSFWITSLDYTSVSSSVLFTNLQVIFVLLFSVLLLKEKISYKVVIGILIALLGSSLIAHGDSQQGRLWGDMLALLRGLFMAIYILAGKKVRDRVDAMTYTSLVSAVAGVVILAACWIGGFAFSAYPAVDWLYFVLLALIPGIAGHGVIIWALKYIKAPVVAVSILGESVGASILAYFFFDEILLWYQLIGGLLILTGIYTAAVNEQPDRSGALGQEIGETPV